MAVKNESMIDLKELAGANRHCIENNCNGCPFYNKEECKKRSSMNKKIFKEFVNMFEITIEDVIQHLEEGIKHKDGDIVEIQDIYAECILDLLKHDEK